LARYVPAAEGLVTSVPQVVSGGVGMQVPPCMGKALASGTKAAVVSSEKWRTRLRGGHTAGLSTTQRRSFQQIMQAAARELISLRCRSNSWAQIRWRDRSNGWVVNIIDQAAGNKRLTPVNEGLPA